MTEHIKSGSFLRRSVAREGATDGHCGVAIQAGCRRAGVAFQRSYYTPTYKNHASLGSLCDEKERSHRTGMKAVIGSAMIYVVLGFPAAFSGIGLHIASYIKVIGKDDAVSHKGIAAVFLLALVLQSTAGLLTEPAVQLFSEKMLAKCACLGVAMCVICAAMCLHSYILFMLWYGMGAGFCSGLVMWLPVKSVIRNNPHWRGFSCGLMYALMGTVLLVMGPIELAYLSPWWITGSNNKHDGPRQRQTEPNNWLYTDMGELHRTKKVVLCLGLLYLVLTALGIRWAFPDDGMDDAETDTPHDSEYVAFAIKERRKGGQDTRQHGWRDQLQ
ncbi:uncharacterized protein BXIN_0761 [Babesia sp. Xinjiang]|uniref:uncharacterized protein n=1 Tax=Babesia sp. Xinjiang TaxID=462227 RepID=UPI000A232DDD|nr:uncharacterized protein BXIN_0761 [Babesia sp. Xinjiang]ORM41353.1 hypothetical protein BXIN_0761 [Babesia sp. Xinjiang]